MKQEGAVKTKTSEDRIVPVETLGPDHELRVPEGGFANGGLVRPPVKQPGAEQVVVDVPPGTGLPAAEVAASRPARPRSAIETECDALAAGAYQVLDDTAALMMSKINSLRRQLDDVEKLVLQGTADAKAKISDQMLLVAHVSEVTDRVEQAIPEMRRLVAMQVTT